MKVYQITFDSCLITAILDDTESLFTYLIKEDDAFSEVDGKIFYDWGSFKEECHVEDMTSQRGIIQWESH